MKKTLMLTAFVVGQYCFANPFFGSQEASDLLNSPARTLSGCSDFTGKWQGQCVDQDLENHQQTLVLAQNGCDELIIRNLENQTSETIVLDGKTTQTTQTSNYSSTISQTWFWGQNGQFLQGRASIDSVSFAPKVVIQVHSTMELSFIGEELSLVMNEEWGTHTHKETCRLAKID